MIALFTKGKIHWDKNTANIWSVQRLGSLSEHLEVVDTDSPSAQEVSESAKGMCASRVILSPILGILNSSKFKSVFYEVNIITFVSHTKKLQMLELETIKRFCPTSLCK